ncbi:hypothetical protein ABZW10_06500 [Kitasatospora sp. NPDC004723]|uniref:hypothetical protein n=1 Tax=Kitasatospora sp. NPDC004723 TaxID=3154288 RepID=UPI0033A16D08
MRPPRYRRTAIALLAALALGAAGCTSGSDKPADEASPSAVGKGPAIPSGAAGAAYLECLRSAGVVVTDGAVDKGKTTPEALKKADAQCGTGQPVPPPTVEPSSLEGLRTLAECMHKNGVPEYPMPDERTGEPVLGDELRKKLKEDGPALKAWLACRPSMEEGGIPGG